MATVSNWIDHLNKPAEDVAGAIYPGVGSEGILVLILAVIWICLLYTSDAATILLV